MRRSKGQGGRAGFGAAILAALALAGCATNTPSASTRLPTLPASVKTTVVPNSTLDPSRPTSFALERIDRTFPAITALTSTGDALYWVADASIWHFAPAEADPTRACEAPAKGAGIWDLAATDNAFVFSELLPNPAGSWHVWFVAGDQAPVELDHGVAEGGAPPTLAIDHRRIAWAGFDESTGTPRSFLRFADRGSPAVLTTLLDLDIEAGLLWYPQLDGDTLWYSIIEPDFEGTDGGDAFHIEALDLTNPSTDPVQFEALDRVFEASVSPDYVVWKAVGPELSALTWGELHVLDRRSNERFVMASEANHPSIGTRFVAFEEISHAKVLLYDLTTRSLIVVPDPLHGAKGTAGLAAVSGSLFAYTVSSKGANAVYWTILPD